MNPAKIPVYQTGLLALALIFSQYQILKADSQSSTAGGRIVGVTPQLQTFNVDSVRGAFGGGIIGVTDQRPPDMNTPGVYKLEDGTETIEFIGKNKVKITKDGIAFIAGCRAANGLLTFRRTPTGKPERFKRWDQILIHEESRTFFYSESTLAHREEFHNRVRTQLDLLPRLTISDSSARHASTSP